MASRLRLGSHFFDAYTRKHWNFQVMAHSHIKLVQGLKTLLSIIIKKIGASEEDKELTGCTYKLDMSSPNFLVPIDESAIPQAA